MRCWFRCRLRCGAGTGGGGGRRGGFFLCYRGLRGFSFERGGRVRDIRLVYVALHYDPCCVYFLLCSRGRLQYMSYMSIQRMKIRRKSLPSRKGNTYFQDCLTFNTAYMFNLFLYFINYFMNYI